MIILLTPLIPQEENYLLWGPKRKDYDLRYPLWHPYESENYPDLASDIHILFYTISIANDKNEQLLLNDNILTVFSTEKPLLPEKIIKGIESFIKEHFYADYLVYIPRNIFLLLNNLKSSLHGRGALETSFDLKSPFYKNLSSDQAHAYKIETGLLCAHSSKPDLACFSIDPQVDTEEIIRHKAGLLLSCHSSGEDSNPDVMYTGQEQPFELVSLGGWCGWTC